MNRTTAPRGLAIGVTAWRCSWRSGATTAWAAKPDKAPSDPTVLDPGQACAFPVEIAPVSGTSSQRLSTTAGFVITGSGHDRVTNLDTSASPRQGTSQSSRCGVESHSIPSAVTSTSSSRPM